MNYYTFVFAALGIVLVLTIVSAFNSKTSRIKRQIKKTPYKPIHQVISGENIQITGTIELVDEPLIAPLSGRACAQYEVIVERNLPHSRKTPYVETIFREEKAGKYLIKQDNSYAYVKPHELFSHIQKDRTFSKGFPDDLNERLNAFDEAHLEKDWHYFNCMTNYFEGILEEGEKVIVCGTGEWKSARSLGLPAEYGRVLCIEASSDGFSVLTDDLKWLKYQHEFKDV